MIWSVMVKVKWNNLLIRVKHPFLFFFYFALVGILVLCRFSLTRFGDPNLFFNVSTLSFLALLSSRRRMGFKSDLSLSLFFFFNSMDESNAQKNVLRSFKPIFSVSVTEQSVGVTDFSLEYFSLQQRNSMANTVLKPQKMIFLLFWFSYYASRNQEIAIDSGKK